MVGFNDLGHFARRGGEERGEEGEAAPRREREREIERERV